MTTRTRRGVVLAVVLVVLALTAALVYRAVRNSGSAEPVSLERVEVAADLPPAPGSGPWVVGDGVVGYRVFEPLDVTVTGRTSAVAGELELSGAEGGTVLKSARVTADLGALRSDADGRDRALRTRILETDRFPTAEFELTRPVTVELESGVPTAVTADGTLTVRDQARPVIAELQVRWDGELRISGRIDVSLSEHGVDVPSAGGVDTIDDAAVVELDLTGRPA